MIVSIKHENDPGAAPVELQVTCGGFTYGGDTPSHLPVVEALTGERVDVALAEWRDGAAAANRTAPRSLTLIGETDTCHACGQKVAPKLDAKVEGASFVASKVGVHVLEVSDGVRRARFKIVVVPREVMHAHPIAVHLGGFNAGKARSMPLRRAMVREWAKTVDEKTLATLSAEAPLPPGVSFSSMGG
jgi:hypothetical protein